MLLLLLPQLKKQLIGCVGLSDSTFSLRVRWCVERFCGSYSCWYFCISVQSNIKHNARAFHFPSVTTERKGTVFLMGPTLLWPWRPPQVRVPQQFGCKHADSWSFCFLLLNLHSVTVSPQFAQLNAESGVSLIFFKSPPKEKKPKLAPHQPLFHKPTAVIRSTPKAAARCYSSWAFWREQWTLMETATGTAFREKEKKKLTALSKRVKYGQRVYCTRASL